MKSWVKSGIAALAAALLLSACAGPRYGDVADRIPALEAAEGRIYFYQPVTSNGDKVAQPAILVDGRKVGRSKPGRFFFVDRAPGEVEVITATDRKERRDGLKVPLASGQTRYVRVDVAGGRQILKLEASGDDAVQAMSDLRYWGAGRREREPLRYE
ncbi:DUF2846 domain-containing protein [Achromobacter sp.]|uniref:DUF2846 domain-containing protein n=1 Tax=Achromobacter sp. TaxID=134375 RepID=UPI002F93F8BF